jgi:sugar lactone lactonase YvrE
MTVMILLLTAGCRSTPEPSDGPLLFFPLPPAQPRIQFLTWASGAGQVQEEKSAFERFTLGEEDYALDTINKPYGIVARDGVIYVCDTKLLNIARLDFKNRSYSVFGDRGPGRLRKPINIVMDSLGYKFVADPIRKQIVVFDPQDRFATAFDIPVPCHPVDVAIHENELYVLDNDDTCQVVVLDRTTGELIRTFGSQGKEPGQFTVPNSLCVDSDGFLYISDTFNHRIQKLTRDGEPIWERGNPGYRLGQFGRPRGIRAGPDDTIYIVEGAMQLVQMFNAEGDVLMRFGGPGNVPGSMVLPSTLAIDKASVPYFKEYIHEDFEVEYLLFVASQYGNHLINIYAFGSFPEGYRLESEKIATLPAIDVEEGIGPVEMAPEGTGHGHGAQDQGMKAEPEPEKDEQEGTEKRN